MVFSYRPPRKRKEIKLFTQESSQQAKEEHEIFLGFLLITTTSMEIKTSMDDTMKKYEHRHLAMSV